MGFARLGEVKLGDFVGERLALMFLAKDVEVRKQKDNVTNYMLFNMVDKDAVFEARIFGVSDVQIEEVKNGGIYEAIVDIKPYAKSPTGYSVIVYEIRRTDEVSPGEFLNWNRFTDKAIDIIKDRVMQLSKSGSIVYYTLVARLLSDNFEKFKSHTAAKQIHHSELGGLIVHTSEVVMISEQLCSYYETRYGQGSIDKNLVLAAAMLHDIGKLDELDVDAASGTTEYSAESALTSHIMIAIQQISGWAARYGFGIAMEGKSQKQVEDEKEQLAMLLHCVGAHHGKLEHGSPVAPCTVEALIVHTADKLSAEFYLYDATLSDMSEKGTLKKDYIGGGQRCTYKRRYELPVISDMTIM